jgi:tetratricopeptide (TPR) repeat protein
MMMRRLLSALLVVALIFGSFPMTAWAADVTKQVEELSGKAAAAYGEGNYERAIELFKEAYALQPVSNLLFNIAKVYEKTENWDEAENFYKEFIKSPDAEGKAREAALERLDAIKQIKDAAAPDPVEKPDDPVEKDPPPPPPPAKKSPLPWIVMGGGGALVAGGVVFGLLASGKQSKFDDATTADEKRDLRKSGKTLALVADSMYVAGAITGVVGVILLLSSGGESEPQAQAVVPTGWVGPNGQAGIGLDWRF